jgi:hypothetical protein
MNFGLLYICAFTGLLIAFGSLLLLWKGRVLVDSAKGEISEVELPGGFKLKTQQPILVMFLFGSFLLALPIYTVKDRLNGIPKVAITGHVENNHELRSLEAYAIIDTKNITNEVKFNLPQLEDFSYRIVFRTPGNYNFVYDQFVDLKQAANGTIRLLPIVVTNLPQQGAATNPSQQIAAAVAPPVNPADIVKEDAAVLGDFK